jgi:hypothetical protein
MATVQVGRAGKGGAAGELKTNASCITEDERERIDKKGSE